tara:strand:- start:7679 stop:7909 length:231 start_codon:yes stop_codon:yes gene_type:complete
MSRFIINKKVKEELVRLVDSGANEIQRRVWKDVKDKSDMKLYSQVSASVLEEVDTAVMLKLREIANRQKVGKVIIK